MLGLGMGEIILIALVILVVVGPDRLPQFMRTAGRMYGQVRRAADEMRRAMVLEADRQDMEERYQRLRDRQAQAEERRRAMEAAGPGTVAADDPVIAPPKLEEEPAQESDGPPDGVSSEEWSELPPHIRQLLAEQTKDTKDGDA